VSRSLCIRERARSLLKHVQCQEGESQDPLNSKGLWNGESSGYPLRAESLTSRRDKRLTWRANTIPSRVSTEKLRQTGKTLPLLWALQGQALISVQQIGHQSANYVGLDLGICYQATEALITSESVPHPTLRGLPGAPASNV